MEKINNYNFSIFISCPFIQGLFQIFTLQYTFNYVTTYSLTRDKY